jgi:serine/threonine-protein kinase
MPPPLTLFHLIGRALLEGVPRLAGAVWRAWLQARDEAARAAELRAIAQSPAEELRRWLGQVVTTLTADRPREQRQALANALGEVARALRRDAAPLKQAGDLQVILPAELPRFPPDADTEPAIVLNVTAGPHAGQTFRFTGHDTFLVGRSKHAHFNLGPDDRYFSRVHFMIEANPPQARLMDMGSSNGTFLNGQPVTAPVVLAEGDRIQAGHTVLAFSLRGALSSIIPPAPPPPPPPPPSSIPPTIGWVPAVPAQEPCRVCNPLPGRHGTPICASCHAQMQMQVQVIPGYQNVRELGRGGMGVVHLSVREADGAVVAVKTIAPAQAGSPEQVERFLREARILEQLDHPHIVAFQEMGEAEGLLYFAMDYLPGTDAAGLLREHGPLPVERAVRLMAQVLQALDYAHAKRFVHRDIKPGNILLTRRDGEEIASLADFGLARVYQASQMSGLTVTGALGGTPAFMAPEQVTGYRDAKPAADQYAAAATLYHLLTGQYTHDLPGSVHERLVQLLHDDPVPIQERRPELPDALAAAIHRALGRYPHLRFADARTFRRALLAALP